MKDRTKTAMELIASTAPQISRRLEELNFSAYFLGTQIWIRSDTDPETDMPLDVFCASLRCCTA